MKRRFALWGILGVVGLVLPMGGTWIFSLPPAPKAKAAQPIPREEADAIIEALKPPKRQRPLVAIVGINNSTEVTDYLMPTGILRRADVADVISLATEPGPVILYPALTVAADATLANFDECHPDGADYVIVPAMSRDDDPAIAQWLKQQSVKGAVIVGVCAGAKVVANAGLLDGKRATTHWYFVKEMLDKHPSIEYVPNRRFVVDGSIVTTTGVTASIPMALTLIEAIAGRDRAQAVGRDVGVNDWNALHNSEAFQLTRPFALTAITNRIAIWNHEKLGLELLPDMDEVSLALVADAWSRTYRSRAVTYANQEGPLKTRNGIRIYPDQIAASWPDEKRLAVDGAAPPKEALDQALEGIGDRYGDRTANFVSLQLEYGNHSEHAPVE